jgi:octaprenyl-diphosphate synthase
MPGASGVESRIPFREGPLDKNPLTQDIRRSLREVDRRIARALGGGEPLLARLADYLTKANGKRARPALVLLTARHLGRIDESAVTLGAAAEMLHAATLVHDDILDDAPLRRHQKTLHFRFGNEMSLLMGDYVFAASFRLLVQDLPREVVRVVSTSAQEVCRGQILETHHRYDARLDEETYLRIASDKTASLLATCCEASAVLAGARKDVRAAFRRFGHLLGVAFQIIDDTLDYTGSSSRLGKPVFSDLKEGRITLPFIHCLERATPAERRVLQAAVERARKGTLDPAPVRVLLARHGSVEYARMKAWERVGEAQSALLRLRGIPRPDGILAYSEYLLRRDH